MSPLPFFMVSPHHRHCVQLWSWSHGSGACGSCQFCLLVFLGLGLWYAAGDGGGRSSPRKSTCDSLWVCSSSWVGIASPWLRAVLEASLCGDLELSLCSSPEGGLHLLLALLLSPWVFLEMLLAGVLALPVPASFALCCVWFARAPPTPRGVA